MISAAFVVTTRCNLRCGYCNSPFLKDKELSLSEIEKLFKYLKKSGVARLGLTGGEPLLRADLHEIILEAKKNKFFTSLNSNLLLYEKYKKVFDDVDFVFTSLDGDKKHHEKKRGLASFDHLISAIASLRSRKKTVVAISVVDDDSYDAVDEVLKIASQYDFKIHFQVRGTEELSYTTNISRGLFSASYSDDSYRAIWKKIQSRKLEGSPIACSKEYIQKVIEWPSYKEFNRYRQGSVCAAGYGFVYVTSNGTAYPCCAINKRIKGVNMLESSWDGKLNSQKPCNECIAGPYLQFNLLYNNPISTLFDIYSMYPLGDKK